MKTKSLFIFLVATCLTSCAGLTRVTVPCSSINAGDRNFETGRFVEYTLKKTYILGIGGLTAKARNTNVIDRLIIKANLKPNESLAYISASENINVYGFGLVAISETTASGYVISYEGGSSLKDSTITLEEIREIKPKYLNTYEGLLNTINSCTNIDDLPDIKREIKESKIGEEQKRMLLEEWGKKNNKLISGSTGQYEHSRQNTSKEAAMVDINIIKGQINRASSLEELERMEKQIKILAERNSISQEDASKLNVLIATYKNILE